MTDKISTQNMGTSGSNLSFTAPARSDVTPMPVVNRTVFTELERQELKEIIREVLVEFRRIYG